jgi:hypothetical protein
MACLMYLGTFHWLNAFIEGFSVQPSCKSRPNPQSNTVFSHPNPSL